MCLSQTVSIAITTTIRVNYKKIKKLNYTSEYCVVLTVFVLTMTTVCAEYFC